MNVHFLFLPMVARAAKMSFRTGRVLCGARTLRSKRRGSPPPRFCRRCREDVDARLRLACAGMTAKEAGVRRTARTKPLGEIPDIGDALPTMNGPLGPGSSRPPRLSRFDPRFHCFFSLFFALFPIVLAPAVFWLVFQGLAL